MRPAKFTFPAMDRDGICTAQTTAGAATLVINGALLDQPATMQGVARANVGAGIERLLSIYSAADLSGVSFTFTGKNLKKETVTESLLGPGAGQTVSTANRYQQVDSITVNGAVATAVEIGSGPSGVTNWMVLDQWKTPQDTTLSIALSGSAISVTIEATVDNVQSDATPATFTPDNFEDVSTSLTASLGVAASAVRANIVSSSGDGAMELTVLQAG